MSLRFSRGEAKSILDDALRVAHWAKEPGTNHLRDLVSNLYSTTWFSTEGLKGVSRSRVGAIAGTPLGDLVFTLAIARLFKSIRAKFVELGLAHELPENCIEEVFGMLPQHLQVPAVRIVFEISFVDDAVFALFAGASVLYDVVVKAFRIIDEQFSRFGFVINYEKGKSEILFIFRGRGAATARVAFHQEHAGKLVFTAFNGDRKIVNCTDRYKHVGSQFVIGGTLMPEVVSRTGAMTTNFRAIRGKLFRNPHIENKNRLLVIQVYLISKGFFQAGTWGSLKVREAATVHASLMRIYRAVLGCDKPKGERVNDSEVIRRLETLAPLSIVVMLRVALLFRIVKKEIGPLLTVVSLSFNNKDSWVQSVYRDLYDLASVSEKLSELRDAPFRTWIEAIRANPKLMYKAIMSALQLPEVNRVAFWWPDGGNKNSHTKRANRDLQHDPICIQCDDCPYVASSMHAFTWHAYKVHGQKHPIRNCVRGTVCEACMKEYYTRERLVRHIISTSPRCRQFYYREAEPLPDDLFDALEARAYDDTVKLIKAGYRGTKSFAPPIRVFGPLHITAHRLGIDHRLLLQKPMPELHEGLLEGEEGFDFSAIFGAVPAQSFEEQESFSPRLSSGRE